MGLTRRKFVGGLGIVAAGGTGVVGFTEIPNSELTRCEGEPISVERSLTDEQSGTQSFEEWAYRQSAEVGLSRVREATANRLNSNEFGSGLVPSPKLLSTELVPVLNVATVEGLDTESEDRSSVDFSRLVRVAPRVVDVTISPNDETFSRSIAVFAEQTVPATAD